MHASAPDLPQPVRVALVACILLEMLAWAGMLAGLGSSVRSYLFGLGAFWPDVLRGAAPLYPGQSVVMFVTSALLHGGPMHLFMNMMALIWLGPGIVQRVGDAAFWPIVGLSALGSGALFTVLSGSGAPMVGASGVIFGMLGTVAVWQVLDRVARRESLAPLVEPALVFIALNVALTVSSGRIAWEAHLGGFLAGAICGGLTWTRPYASRWN